MFFHCHKIIFLACLCALVGCKREQRETRVVPPLADDSTTIQLTDLVPGSPTNQAGAGVPESFLENYENNSYQLSQGQTLYQNYNCNTCHAHGGGDIGPPLLDNKWIYGSEPQQIFASIVQGRPKGMPAFGPRLNANQTWELVVYIRSLSGLTPKTIASGRDDHMQTGPAPNSIGNPPPKNAYAP
jgi:cytochrome c oxidase cbb3-type subunit 3